MERLYQYDLCALIIFIAILFSVYFRRLNVGRVNNAFINIIYIMMFDTIFEILQNAPLEFLGDLGRNETFRTICYYGGFITHAMIMPSYVLFIGMISGTWSRLIHNKVFHWAFAIPFMINILVVLANPINHMLFILTRENGVLVYHRRPLISVFYIVAAYYMFISVIYIMKTMSMIGRAKTVALLAIFPCNIIALFIQFIAPANSVEMFAMSISSFLVTVTVLRAEELVDPGIGSRTFPSFHEDIKRYYRSDKDVSVIMMKIKNDEPIVTLFGSTIHRELIKEVISRIKTNYAELITHTKVIMNIYYLYYGNFAVVFDNYEHKDENLIRQKTENLLNELNDNFVMNDNRMNLDMCMCYMKIPGDIPDINDFESFIDSFEKTISSKELVFFSDIAPERKFQLQLDIDKIIKKAIDKSSFEMYYQPIYSLKEKRFTSAEALIRLKDEEVGFVSPGLFIPAAEKNGAIHSIGDFVIDDVFKFISDNKIENYGLNYIEINLSTIQCLQNKLPEHIDEKIKEYNISKNNINFEVTETGRDYVRDIIYDTIYRIHDMNLALSLDDYGTGYSNLQKIVALPFKIIKIDKSLVDNMNDGRMRDVIKQTVTMLKKIGAEIVVEGVESKEASDWFEEIGCDFIQGYYYAKPMPKQEFLKFIRQHNG
ncbi:MAG: EAL domain-containing protein [Lachnospiraceae bacterium]|nr:EAL domain-containing protein [Lachnospiraceae bacterium]